MSGAGTALSLDSLSLAEDGDLGEFLIALTQAPTSDVTFSITSSDELEAIADRAP